MNYSPIPLDAGRVSGWKDIPISQNHRRDPLVPLGLFSEEAAIVVTSSLYFGEHSNSPYADSNELEGSLLTLFARRSVARRLVAAQRLLPAGHHLLVFDAYRSYRVQKSLYDFYKQNLRKKYPDMDDRALEAETQNYVSLPSTEPTRPSPHNTGGAVDVGIVKLDHAHEQELQSLRSRVADDSLGVAERVGLELQLATIMRHHATMLDFGTAFDHGGKKSALAYYESATATGQDLSERDARACRNRRLLFRVMTQAGFQPYFAEWWHFNAPESQMGAATAGLDHAMFGAARLDETHWAHEAVRRAIRQDANLGHDWPAEIMAPPADAR